MQYSLQCPADDFAQSQSRRGCVRPESRHQAAGEFDREGDFGISDRNRPFQWLRLLEIAISLALGDGTGSGEMFDGLGQLLVFAQQSASQVEPLGFLDIAGTSHLS